jgi:hypothetical protein
MNTEKEMITAESRKLLLDAFPFVGISRCNSISNNNINDNKNNEYPLRISTSEQDHKLPLLPTQVLGRKNPFGYSVDFKTDLIYFVVFYFILFLGLYNYANLGNLLRTISSLLHVIFACSVVENI